MTRARAKVAFGMAVLVLLVTAAVFAPLLAPYNPNAEDLMNTLAAPLAPGTGGGIHLLGTDQLGQDVASRVIYGARVALIVSLGAAGSSALIGVPLGLAAGFLGRTVQSVVLAATDIVLSIPFILLALVLMSVLGVGLANLVIAFALVRWAQFARITYTLSLELREKEYVLSCRAAGIRLGRTLLVHVLPNLLGAIVVIATLELAYAILAESGLSFLGLGAPPEVPSWGGMLQQGRDQLDTAWWLTVAPGLAIMTTAIACNFIGDWLRDRLDPRTQGVLR